MNHNKIKFIYSKPELLCYKQSVAFAAPNNRVQSVALANRHGNYKSYSSYSLLELYMDGWRIDYKKFHGFISNAAHQEVEFEFVRREENE